jgi:hypothetical protein
MKVLVDTCVWSMALRRQLPIFTTDAGFTFFQQYLPIKLHSPRTI